MLVNIFIKRTVGHYVIGLKNYTNLSSITIVHRFFSTKVYTNKEDIVSKLAEKKSYLGKVIVLNGTSSIGKTTFADYLTKFGFYKISYDDIYYKNVFNHLLSSAAASTVLKAQDVSITEEDIHRIYAGYKVKKNKYQPDQLHILGQLEKALATVSTIPDSLTDQNMFTALYNQARSFIFSGRNVVIDMVLEREQMPLFRYCFDYYKDITVVLLYFPLVENLKRCFARNNASIENDYLNHRYLSNVIDNYCDLYKFLRASDEHMSRNPVILEKIDKISTKEILDKTLEHKRLLLSHLHDDPLDYKVQEKELKTLIAIERVKNLTHLDSTEDIFVMPATEADFIVSMDVLGDQGADRTP